MTVYQSNFLKEVVIRVDYDTVAALASEAVPDTVEELKNHYPSVRGISERNVTFEFSESRSSIAQGDQGVRWELRDKEDGDRCLNLSKSFAALSVNNRTYTDFPSFLQAFESVHGALLRNHEIDGFTRVGLRYINEFTIESGSPLDWQGYLADGLAAAASVGRLSKSDLVRSMHQVQSRVGEHTVVVNYGIVNPDFPNPVARKHYILDIDVFRTGEVPQFWNELESELRTMNDLTVEVFESSIESELRKLMGQ